GGWGELPAQTLYENQEAFPRAFVVPRAASMPGQDDVLAALGHADFHEVVFLEGPFEELVPEPSPGRFREARITSYQPNRVVVEADGPGWLVLTDVEYPGWECTVDGETVPVRRGDYLFRAVRLPPGGHEVVFTFDPASYRWGRLVSGVALA